MRRFLLVPFVAVSALQAQGRGAAAPAAKLPERAIRNTIPMTNIIQRAFAAGVRDSSGRPTGKYWQIRTDYDIAVKLDAPSSRLTGKATITLHNNSPDSMMSVGLRLDPNIFRPRAYLASSWLPSETTDGMVITALSVDGVAADLTAPAGGRGGPGGRGGGQGGAPAPAAAPRLVNPTSTIASIALAKPIPARGTATLVIEWNHKLPGGQGSGHRMTQRWGDTLYQPTQWYPRVQVYDDLKGWNADMYLGPSEFYNNFGTWDVAIDVPAGWLVSGTGVLKNPEQVLTPTARQRLATVTGTDQEVMIVGPDEVGPGQATAAGDRLTWRFHADTVNDFAWLTAKKLVWRSVRANIPTKGYIPIHMLYQPGNANAFAQAGAISRHALEFYSKLWFPYQWPQFTMQDGPSAGMEYPMVINSNAGAADHEAGHQWWPMTVSNNETWYGWMDEGFNQYMNILSDADAAGRVPNLNGNGQRYGSTSGNEAEPPMMWNANFGGSMYSFQTYQKTPLMLSMLGGIVGDSVVQRAHREWGIAWMYKHPSPWDYMFFMNKALKQDLSWFWYYWLFTTEAVNGSLKKVTPSATGVAVTVHQAGEMPSPVVLRVEFDPKGPAIRKPANAVMKDSVTAVVTYPVDVWFNGKRDFTATLNFGGRKITRIILDPGCRFPDKQTFDNSWTPEGGIPTAPTAPAAGGGRGGAGGGSNLCPGA